VKQIERKSVETDRKEKCVREVRGKYGVAFATGKPRRRKIRL
jgi:hypothetical protein